MHRRNTYHKNTSGEAMAYIYTCALCQNQNKAGFLTHKYMQCATSSDPVSNSRANSTVQLKAESSITTSDRGLFPWTYRHASCIPLYIN